MTGQQLSDFVNLLPNHAEVQYYSGTEWAPLNPKRLRAITLPFDARQKEKSHDPERPL